jgi:hypothetical protein
MPFRNKHLHALPVFGLGGRHIKPYHITREPDGTLRPRSSGPPTRWRPGWLRRRTTRCRRASWLVLHEGKGAMYLCLYDWVWGNAVRLGAAAAGEPFLGCTDDDLTHFIVPAQAMVGCVWELATLEHERAAWARHMLVPDVPDLDAYLADRIPEGPVGLVPATGSGWPRPA